MSLKVGIDFDLNGWVELNRASGDADNLFGRLASDLTLLTRATTAGAVTVATNTDAIGVSEVQYYGHIGLLMTAVDTNDRYALGWNGAASYNITGQASGTYSAGVWVKSQSGTPTMRIRLISSGGTTVTGSTVVTTTSWQRLTASGSLPHAAQSIRIEVECTSGSSAGVYVVGAMVVSGATLPAYLNCGTDGQYENISDYVQRARWNYGFTRPYQYVAGVGRASLVLTNSDKRFSPEAAHAQWTADNLNQQMMIFIASGDERLWTGYVTEWKPQAGTKYEQLCELNAEDHMRFFQNTEIFPNLATSATPQTLIDVVVALTEETANMNFREVHGYTGYSSDLSTIETETVPYYFDQTPNESDKQGQQPVSLLTDILTGIQAKFWIDRWGARNYAGPNEDGGAVGATFDNTAISLDYQWGQNIVNRCEVKAYPRRAGGSTTQRLWRLRETLTVKAGETEIVRAYFTQEGTDTRCGSEPGTVALSGLTYSGAGLAASITDVDAMSCEISVVNSTGVARDWTAGDVLGRELTIEDTISRMRENTASIAGMGLKGEKVDSRWVAKGRWAKRLAAFRIARFVTPRGEVVSLTGRYDIDSQFADCYVGKKINVADDQLGHDANYIVVGEDHRWELGDQHWAKIYLEPVTSLIVSGMSV